MRQIARILTLTTILLALATAPAALGDARSDSEADAMGVLNGIMMKRMSAEFELFANEQGYTLAKTEFTGNERGFAAIAAIEGALHHLDLVAGTDVAAVYVLPAKALRPHELPQGMFTLRLQEDPEAGIQFLLVDRQGEVAATIPAILEVMEESDGEGSSKVMTEASIRLDLDNVEPSLHGICWIIGSGSIHGICWAFPV